MLVGTVALLETLLTTALLTMELLETTVSGALGAGAEA